LYEIQDFALYNKHYYRADVEMLMPQETAPVEEAIKKCPKCGWILSKGKNKCPRCQFVISTEPEKPPEPKEDIGSNEESPVDEGDIPKDESGPSDDDNSGAV
jgi:tRNA(Ile2) C34 agmatinyltransferase TiaS